MSSKQFDVATKSKLTHSILYIIDNYLTAIYKRLNLQESSFYEKRG